MNIEPNINVLRDNNSKKLKEDLSTFETNIDLLEQWEDISITPESVSIHFNKYSLKGFLRCGRIVIGDEFFNKTPIKHLDRMLNYLNKDDLSGLVLLFSIFSLTPTILIKFLFTICEKNKYFPSFIGTGLRKVYLGLRGIYFTLHYSNLDKEDNMNKVLMQAFTLTFLAEWGDRSQIATIALV